MHIRKRIDGNFSGYRKKGYFIDCNILLEDHEISAHKIILAKYSNYFWKLFNENHESPYVFKATYNPQNMLEKVIDFFYDNSISFDQKNIIALLAISRYYQIKNLEEIIINYLPQHSNEDTALGFCQKCVEFKIQDQAKHFVQIIAKNWSNYRRETVFKNVDPTILSLILKEPMLKSLNDDAKLQIIDQFFEYNDVHVNDSEREMLTSVIDWTDDLAYQKLTRHDCKWIHPRTARPLLRRINQERRDLILKLDDEIKQSDLFDSTDCSKWFLFTRMINIRQANSESSDSKSSDPVINYISSYGDLIEGYDAVTTGAITVESTPPMSKDIKVNFALGTVKGQKFISIGSAKKNPYYGINFGPRSKLLASKLIVRCSTPEQFQEKLRKLKTSSSKVKECEFLCPNPTRVQVIGYQSLPNEREVVLYDGNFSEEIDISTNDFGPLSKVTFYQTDKNVAGNYILRISSIEILGEFVL